MTKHIVYSSVERQLLLLQLPGFWFNIIPFLFSQKIPGTAHLKILFLSTDIFIRQKKEESTQYNSFARKIHVFTSNYGTAATMHEVKLHSKLQGALLREEETGLRNASNSHPQLDF